MNRNMDFMKPRYIYFRSGSSKSPFSSSHYQLALLLKILFDLLFVDVFPVIAAVPPPTFD